MGVRGLVWRPARVKQGNVLGKVTLHNPFSTP